MIKIQSIIYAIVIYLLLIGNTKADEVTIYLGGWSEHYNIVDKDNKNQFNGSHNIIGIKYKNILLSKFKNSYYKNSYLLAYEWRYADYDFKKINIGLSITSGFVTGYTKKQNHFNINNTVSLYLSPTASIDYKLSNVSSAGFTLGLLPSEVGVATIVMLQFSRKF